MCIVGPWMVVTQLWAFTVPGHILETANSPGLVLLNRLIHERKKKWSNRPQPNPNILDRRVGEASPSPKSLQSKLARQRVGGETEAPRGEGTCPKPCSSSVAEPELQPGHSPVLWSLGLVALFSRRQKICLYQSTGSFRVALP